MASNPLRAAHAMKALVSNGMRAFTSRTIASTYGNNLTICNSRLLHTHWTSQTNTSIATPIRQFRFMSTAAAEQAQPVDGSTKRDVKSGLRNLERAAQAFEDRTVNREQVLESDFVRLFDNFAKSVEEDPEGSADDCSTHSQIAGLLLKCCGNLMYDVPPKGRELLAGNLWTFIKEKNVPIDISHYNSLLRLLNENGTTFNPQMIMDEIKQHSLQPDRVTYQRLIHQYCLQGDIANATKLLETMKDADVELTEAIFASLILGYSKQDSPPSPNEMFELMRSNGIEPGAKAYVASLVALAGRFNADPASAFKELADIFTSISAQDIILTPNEQIDLINHLGPLANSHESVANLINSFLESKVPMGYEHKVHTALLRANLFELASKTSWNQMPSDRAVERGNIGKYYLQALCRNHNIPVEFVMQESAKLEEKRWFTKATHASFRETAIAGPIDSVRALLKRTLASQPLKGAYTWPFIAQAKNQDEITRVLREDLDPKFTSDVTKLFTGAVLPVSQLNFFQLILFPYTYSIMYYMDFLLNYFPWWQSIIITTATARIILFPLVVKQNIIGIKSSNIMPETQKLQVQLNEAMVTGDQYNQAIAKTKLQLLFKEHGITMFERFKPIFIQAPMYASIFLLIRGLTGIPAEGLSTGGALWFTDLTVPDPYYLLPALTSTSMFMLLEFGIEGGSNPKALTPVVRYFLRAMPFGLFLFIQSFPAATLLFWSTSNLLTLVYALVLRQSWIKRKFNIPERIVHDPKDLPMTNMSFKGQLNNAIEKGKVRRTSIDVRRLDDIKFKKAGIGPLRKTYKEPPS